MCLSEKGSFAFIFIDKQKSKSNIQIVHKASLKKEKKVLFPQKILFSSDYKLLNNWFNITQKFRRYSRLDLNLIKLKTKKKAMVI